MRFKALRRTQQPVGFWQQIEQFAKSGPSILALVTSCVGYTRALNSKTSHVGASGGRCGAAAQHRCPLPSGSLLSFPPHPYPYPGLPLRTPHRPVAQAPALRLPAIGLPQKHPFILSGACAACPPACMARRMCAAQGCLRIPALPTPNWATGPPFEAHPLTPPCKSREHSACRPCAPAPP